ncbi:MAG: ribulose-phosphate 3-epimerase [Chloroflexi bacterium]|nr:ribulose-phosphate 3-epimerase [Chloroflexota bacterium]
MIDRNRAPVKLAPSILSADFGRMGDEVALAVENGADYIHVDVMDGRFVPPISFGVQMVEAIKRRAGRVPLDVHLMIHEPMRLVSEFVDAGADLLVVHAEACRHLHRTVWAVKEKGARVGVGLNPGSPVELLDDVIDDLDMALVMSVNPGYSAQRYIAGVLPKIVRIRKLLDERNPAAELEVDGGMNEATLRDPVRAGATVLVAGSAIYGQPAGVAERMKLLRERIAAAAE